MGQKVNPKIFRLGQFNSWDSRWFSQKNYIKFLHEDMVIKKFLKTELREAAVERIEIERSANVVTVIIHTAKPGIIIGRGGQGVEELKKKIKTKILKSKVNLNLTIKEVKNPNVSAELVLQSMVTDLEKRIPFRRVMKQAIGRVEKSSALGVKVVVAGRLNGAEIARTESLSSGSLPLHTLRADIDYSRGAARTTYGAIGVKVWIYKGERFKKDIEAAMASVATSVVSPVASKKSNNK
ncbi:MAG: 30S ribosomal protein S3 [Candidatus Buchananbacteria bacterium RIFCSPLOWO2_01_FULL_46_12]|uniref:Small ribosomal subunit protein uS3 n=2 Tax=Candidatus Buchananiibacteriota TaxID=1817903 RepID=A0A1G1YR65_9BACT|nr:MAG: 30S ribosomal protein S3 [Candidatus Buchananbacteria bacterium RIFCSPHIGHO2_01_FULL_44_11]OGY54843.1 MAG: 30S ribosomal protein S3 [Candidatus Buchananbacteria bacterium RIFCSPLOWO2_01_FULL_46_12]